MDGRDFENLIAFLQERVFPYHAREPHPHFMGYIPSSPTFPAVVGDWLAAGYNFFAGVWSVASGPNQIELTVLDWFRSWLGMPAGTGGLLTSGGSTATLTGVVAARHAADPAGENTHRLTLYTSEQAHSSVQRAAWIAGIPRINVRSVATDDSYRLRDELLRTAISDDRACRFHSLPRCRERRDDEHGRGGSTQRDRRYLRRRATVDARRCCLRRLRRLDSARRGCARRARRADSVTLDPHKWLFVPFECGCLLAREPRKLEEAFSVHPEYLTDVRARDQDVNFADHGEQLTRSSHALKIWLSLQYFGVSQIREAIARGIHRAEYAERLFAAHRDFEILSPAQFGVVCFRAHPPGVDDAAELDELNERINTRVNATGRFLISSTKLRGRFSLRLCTQVHRMTDADIDEVYEAIVEALRRETLTRGSPS
jgi:glutamate/tyrosine decarboxylase-like PLP-dependent enzyme